jgi:hypothetical protein
MQTLPFQLSPEAEAWLSRLPRKEGQAPGFVCSPRYGVYRGADLVEEFGGAHYSFVYAAPVDWASERSATPLVIGDREFWFTSETLDGLRGKTLAVVRSDVGKKQSVVREFLVALDRDSPATRKKNSFRFEVRP